MSPRGPAMGFEVPPFTRGVKWLGIVTLAVVGLVVFFVAPLAGLDGVGTTGTAAT